MERLRNPLIPLKGNLINWFYWLLLIHAFDQVINYGVLCCVINDHFYIQLHFAWHVQLIYDLNRILFFQKNITFRDIKFVKLAVVPTIHNWFLSNQSLQLSLWNVCSCNVHYISLLYFLKILKFIIRLRALCVLWEELIIPKHVLWKGMY